MKSMVYVGASVESVKAYQEAIINIIQCCADTHMEQNTIRWALTTLENGVSVKDTTIRDCTFINNKEDE